MQKIAENCSLTSKQERLIAALLRGLTVGEAATSCKISERTAYNWLKKPLFQQEYQAARKRLLNHSLTSLQLKFDKAVSTLDRHLENAKTIPRDQIKAAEVVVDKTIQTAQLLERIAELEAQLAVHEQDRIYKVIFDLRELTKEEREALEAIDDSLSARKAKVTE